MNEEQLSGSITEFLCDPTSLGSGINILQLHSYLHAAAIVLTARFGNPPTPQDLIHFSQVVALNDLKNAVQTER